VHPILDPDVKTKTVPGMIMSPVPLDAGVIIKNLAEVAGKSTEQVVALIITEALPEITRQIIYELGEKGEETQDEMAFKLSMPKPPLKIDY